MVKNKIYIKPTLTRRKTMHLLTQKCVFWSSMEFHFPEWTWSPQHLKPQINMSYPNVWIPHRQIVGVRSPPEALSLVGQLTSDVISLQTWPSVAPLRWLLWSPLWPWWHPCADRQSSDRFPPGAKPGAQPRPRSSLKAERICTSTSTRSIGSDNLCSSVWSSYTSKAELGWWWMNRPLVWPAFLEAEDLFSPF